MERILVKTNSKLLLLYIVLVSLVAYVLFIQPGFVPVAVEEDNLGMATLLFFLFYIFYLLGQLCNARKLVLVGRVLELRFSLLRSKNISIPLDDLITVSTPKFGMLSATLVFSGSRNGNEKETVRLIQEEIHAFSNRTKEMNEKNFLLRDTKANEKNMKKLRTNMKKVLLEGSVRYASPGDVSDAVSFLQPYVESNMKGIDVLRPAEHTHIKEGLVEEVTM